MSGSQLKPLLSHPSSSQAQGLQPAVCWWSAPSCYDMHAKAERHACIKKKSESRFNSKCVLLLTLFGIVFIWTSCAKHLTEQLTCSALQVHATQLVVPSSSTSLSMLHQAQDACHSSSIQSAHHTTRPQI